MQKERDRYTEKGIITFSVNISQKYNENKGTYIKNIKFPSGWQKSTINNAYFNNKYNGLAILTGKTSNLIIIDIDNTDDWEKLLEDNKKKEPKTAKSKSGTKGFHLYFQYDEELGKIKSNSKSFNKVYDIDVRSNGGCIIAPPTSYHNNNTDSKATYEWIVSIHDKKPAKLPIWLKKLLLSKNNVKKELKEINKSQDSNKQLQVFNNKKKLEEIMTTETSKYTLDYSDVKKLLFMIDKSRCDNYNDWINVGFVLRNSNDGYVGLYDEWSKQSSKYEVNKCFDKWKTFDNDKNSKLTINSLMSWAKYDNPNQFNHFMKEKHIHNLVTQKYSNENLLFGPLMCLGSIEYNIPLNNEICFIKKAKHSDMEKSMYVQLVGESLTIKCRHPDCFGKSYPCNHIIFNKNEINIITNYNITINKKDDEELIEFNKINLYNDNEINELVFNSLIDLKNQMRLAKLMFYFCKDTHVYAENNMWYWFNGNKWLNLGEKNEKLRALINNKSVELFTMLIDYYKQNNEGKNKIKAIKELLKYCNNTQTKNQIIEEIITLKYEENNGEINFLKKLDSNYYLLGFNNGVYDFKNMQFRETRPNDYVSMSVGYDFNDKYSEHIDELKQFLEDILPIKEDRDYLLQYLANSITGNHFELLSILSGVGRNGKSKLIELLNLTFGEYFGNVASQMFTRKRPDSQAPDPGLLNLMKLRFVIGSEPEKNEKLNTGFLKFLTGRDATSLRQCHSNEIVEFRPNFITLLICNDIPDTDGTIDNAFSKRLRCIHFPNEFVEEPKESNQRKINTNINERFELWKNDLILLLIDYYKKNTSCEPLKVPDNINKWTEMYKEDVDVYIQFMNENIIKTNKDEDRITFREVYDVFKLWFKILNPNTKIPTNREFGKGIKKYLIFDRIRIDGQKVYGTKGHLITEQ